MDSQIIFVCGHRKCGTTLLLNLLDNHPELAVYPIDVAYFYGYFPTYIHGEFTLDERRARFDRVVFTELQSHLARSGLSDRIDVARFREMFFADIGRRLGDMRAVTNTMAESYKKVMRYGNRPVVLKETSIEIYASEILAWHPNAKFIHILRDPRDNYSALKAGVESYYAQFGDDQKSLLASMLHRARLSMLYAAANQKLFDRDRYHVIRFEDLVGESDVTLGRLREFLGISDSKTMKVPTILGQPTKGNSFEGFDFSALSSRNIGRWKSRITQQEAAIIEFHFGETMDMFGYERAIPLEQQASAAAEFYKWQNYRYFYFDRFAGSAG